MKKQLSLLLLSLMGFGLFGMAQPVEVEAANFIVVAEAGETDKADIFKDFDVTIDDEGKVTVDTEVSQGGAWNTLMTKYKGFIIAFGGLATISMVGVFILNFLKLGASAGNPKARAEALAGIMWSGVAVALLGAVSLIVGIFYGFIN